jgi:hypothetical protein
VISKIKAEIIVTDQYAAIIIKGSTHCTMSFILNPEYHNLQVSSE